MLLHLHLLVLHGRVPRYSCRLRLNNWICARCGLKHNCVISDGCLPAQELKGMEEAVSKVKSDAKRSADERAAALAEVTKLEALVAQLKQSQSKGLGDGADKVRSVM